MYRDPQWDKLVEVEEKNGADPALALIYQWVKTNVISKSDFLKMVRYVLSEPEPYAW